MPQLKPTITLEIDSQEAAIIGSALLEQANRCHDQTRARLNRIIAAKVYEARRHHEAVGAVLMQRYFGEGARIENRDPDSR